MTACGRLRGRTKACDTPRRVAARPRRISAASDACTIPWTGSEARRACRRREKPTQQGAPEGPRASPLARSSGGHANLPPRSWPGWRRRAPRRPEMRSPPTWSQGMDVVASHSRTFRSTPLHYPPYDFYNGSGAPACPEAPVPAGRARTQCAPLRAHRHRVSMGRSSRSNQQRAALLLVRPPYDRRGTGNEGSGRR